MKKTSETIVFFGSGPVASASLELLAKRFPIEAVVTKPRPAHHKGDVPVLRTAKKLGLRVETVTDKTSLDALVATCPFSSRLAVLIDFGIIVSQTAIDYFPMGIINSHFSLLPQWRGADPITFSVLSGQPATGVSLMLLAAGMDEGPLLAQSPLSIEKDQTTPGLTEELVGLSDAMLGVIIPEYLAGNVEPRDQDMSIGLSYSRKLTKQDGILDWQKDAASLEREIRAYAGWPKSTATFGGDRRPLQVTVIAARVEPKPADAKTLKPGATLVITKQPAVVCGDGAVLVLERVKPAGKKEMTGEAFLAGYKTVFLAD